MARARSRILLLSSNPASTQAQRQYRVNSWGTETDKITDDLGNVTGNGTYGVRDENGKATGYFYLSYYDRSILRPETMAFSAGLLNGSDSFEVLQHDYMAAQNGFYTTEASSDVTSSANVFEVPHDLSIKAVSTLTSEENQRVTFSIYRMDDGATTPTDGTMLYRTSCNFECAGFHRLDLEWPVAVKAGEKIAVVSTGSFCVNETMGMPRLARSAHQHNRCTSRCVSGWIDASASMVLDFDGHSSRGIIEQRSIRTVLITRGIDQRRSSVSSCPLQE